MRKEESESEVSKDGEDEELGGGEMCNFMVPFEICDCWVIN